MPTTTQSSIIIALSEYAAASSVPLSEDDRDTEPRRGTEPLTVGLFVVGLGYAAVAVARVRRGR